MYSSHLDLSGYGHGLNQAKESFKIAFDDFIDYTLKHKTLEKVLQDLGTESHAIKCIASTKDCNR